MVYLSENYTVHFTKRAKVALGGRQKGDAGFEKTPSPCVCG